MYKKLLTIVYEQFIQGVSFRALDVRDEVLDVSTVFELSGHPP